MSQTSLTELLRLTWAPWPSRPSTRRRRACSRLRRGAGRLRLLAPRRRWEGVLHRRRRSQALLGGGAHAQRDPLAGGKAGDDGPGANDGGPFVPQDGGCAADPDAQDGAAGGGLRAARRRAGAARRGAGARERAAVDAAGGGGAGGGRGRHRSHHGRPTCAVLPEAINSARTAASFGCIGNRVYTGADDTEAYFAIPGLQLGASGEAGGDRARQPGDGEVPPRARRRDADEVG